MKQQIRIKVLFCGPAEDWAGVAQRRYEVAPETTLGAFAGVLAADYPKLAPVQGVRLAVNRSYVPLNHVLADGDEVATIPMVSGG